MAKIDMGFQSFSKLSAKLKVIWVEEFEMIPTGTCNSDDPCYAPTCRSTAAKYSSNYTMKVLAQLRSSLRMNFSMLSLSMLFSQLQPANSPRKPDQ